MADKELGDLTSATTLDGTEIFYAIQSANSRKVAGSEIVKISHNQAWSTITSTPTTLSGYGITDAQALDSNLTAIAALDKTDGNFIVANGTAWTVESGATARTSLGLGTAATTAATDYATAAQGTTADSALQPGDIGTTVQAQGATLDSLERLTLASGDVLYATAADTLTNLAKGTEGQVLKVSATGIPEWGTVAGTGDMLAATYDPTSVAGDAFDMANMVEATDAKIMTAAERTKLAGIEAGADVTDATNVDAAGATMNTDTDVSGNSWVLDEDDMASDSAAKVPTQQSVKAKIDNDTILKVADRTALKAVDTVAHTSVYLRSIGRQANFIADDMSAFVAIDTQEILYVAPTSDPTGASGAWEVQRESWYFDLEWAKDFSGDGVADDTTAIKGAVSLAEFLGVGTEIRVPNKVSLISEKISITSGIRIVARHGLGNATTGVPTAMVARWIWDSSVAGDTMVEVKATTTGEVVNYFAMLGLTLDANNTATNCLIMSSVAFFELDFVTFRPVNNGCRINDANGALSNGGTIKRYYHFCGSDPAAWNSNGLFIDGDVTGSYCTSIKAEYIECEFVNGHALTIRATDSVSIDRFKPYLRSGSGGTGFALRYLKSTFGTPTFHAQKNLIKHMFGSGNIYVGDYCKGNIIDVLTSESGYIIYESSGANKRVLHINHLQDFRFSDAWATKKWALDDQVIVPLPECITYGTTAPTSETAGAIACGRAFTFADAVQAGIGWAGPIPPNWNDGFITGIKLTLCTKGATAGNVGFRVQFNAADVGSGVGGFTVDQTFVLTPSASANTLSEHVCTFTAEQAVSRDGYMFLAIERLGGGGTDTYAASIQIIGIEIQYRGEGPDSGATYGPYPQFLDIDPANP